MATSVYSNTVSLDVEDEEPLSLSDLVRTAETSRLRRRGAIAGGHRARQSITGPSANDPSLSANVQQYQGNQMAVTASMLLPLWATNGGIGSSAMTGVQAQQPQVQQQRQQETWTAPDVNDPTKAEDDADVVPGSGYALHCGVEAWEFGDEEPYEPSPIPLPFDDEDDSPSPSSTIVSKRKRKSTGCGALIHLNGKPSPRNGTWQASGKACSNVVPMDKTYFERGGQAKLFSCGCRWHGVGCATCGNPLGNVYMPCQVATTTSSVSRDPSRLSRAPSNPAAHFVYTFFSDAVSSTPEYEFPPTCAANQAQHMRAPFMASMDAVAQTWDGTTEYSYGYAEAEPGQEQEQEEPGAEYDSNGVLIASGEPGSPDKPGPETMMLWPAR